MAPRKREKELDKNRMDHAQADHELFLQAFEKPTQIYKYLRNRSLFSPLFLVRTLSYMRANRPRPKRPKKKIDIDSLLMNIVEKKLNEKKTCNKRYLTITYIGYFDDKINDVNEPIKIETSLIKISHKKRKDACPWSMISYGLSAVPVNPQINQQTCNLTSHVSPVSIPVDSLATINGHVSKSHHLLLRIMNMASNSDSENTEPSQKKRRMSIKEGNGVSKKEFGANLIIHDKQNRCLLKDGDYDCIVEELNANPISSIGKSASWERLKEVKAGPQYGAFENRNKIKLRLKWSAEPTTSAAVEYPLVDNKENSWPSSISRRSSSVQNANGSVENSSSNKLKIVYQFLYNNNSRQQTEASEDLHCPWCTLDCFTLYALLKHLKLCHARFTFSYVPTGSGARIDVAINENYDGCYIGSPQDLIAQPQRDESKNVGYRITRVGPVRRAVVSKIVVCHPKRLRRASLSEFLHELEDTDGYDGQRPYVTGHNRLYHHTSTCLPIYPREMDEDSEDESDPIWLRKKTAMMIDEFTDVNDGEKEIMKMWNLHVMKEGFVGDCQISLALSMFVELKGKDILRKNLYRNFMLHLCNLCDLRLISPVTFYTTIQKLQDIIAIDSKASNVLYESFEAQRKYWREEGAKKSEDRTEIRCLVQSPLQSDIGTRRKPAGSFYPLKLQDKLKGKVIKQQNSRKGSSSARQNPPATKNANIIDEKKSEKKGDKKGGSTTRSQSAVRSDKPEKPTEKRNSTSLNGEDHKISATLTVRRRTFPSLTDKKKPVPEKVPTNPSESIRRK
ncbi:polycomb protein suz12-B [Adelges cooleyi]|uniref:polycomb protein suz12-B n=1 Tax=Adelges cooleyi TaxID=133065 RepID=UPI0021804E26|nr:polycomb protein suz12-B [Adelges cooleyi]